MPAVAFVTVWWLLGFNVLLFIAGLRNISTEIYEAAGLDGAGRWAQFTPHHLAADLAGDGAGVHDPAHSPAQDLRSGLSVRQRRRVGATMVMVQFIFKEAFQMNKGGLAAAASVVLFVLIVVLSVLQFQLLSARGAR